MALDYNSLLVSVGFSAAGLAFALVGSWLLVRTERFMLTWSIGLVLIVGNVTAYSQYVQSPSLFMGGLSMVLLLLAFSVLYGAAVQFVRGISPFRAILATGLPSAALVIAPMLIGLDGIGFFVENVGAGLLLFLAGAQYWRGRGETRIPLIGLAVLYCAVGATFLLCALMIVVNGEIVLSGPPDNWAENLSLIVCLVGMTGIGALSLALNQWRLAGRHKRDAMTDPLTGLLNRRALVEMHGRSPLAGDTVVAVFDLDHFKSINDLHGHAIGDEVLRRFAATLVALIRSRDTAARLGGEEFALILPGTPPLMAVQIAELVRQRFSAETFRAEAGTIRCTVSAGVAVAAESGPDLEASLLAADRALYLAKTSGRDRIVPASRLRA